LCRRGPWPDAVGLSDTTPLGTSAKNSLERRMLERRSPCRWASGTGTCEKTTRVRCAGQEGWTVERHSERMFLAVLMNPTQPRRPADAVRRRIALAVTELRVHRGWSTFELAQRAEVSESRIEAIEAATDPGDLDTLAALADAFNVPVRRLVEKTSSLDH
jgi:ribosome-binding protein aMBF1 (putative translation factor)